MLNKSPNSGRLHIGDLVRLKIAAWYDFSYTKNATPQPFIWGSHNYNFLTLKGNDAQRVHRRLWLVSAGQAQRCTRGRVRTF